MSQGPEALVDTCFVRLINAVLSFTTTVAEAVLPSPPSVEETAEVVLSFVPAVVPVTVKLKVQLLFAAIEPATTPEPLVRSEITRVEATLVKLIVPPHTDCVPSVIVSPAGKVSVKPILDSELIRFGLVMVNVRVVVLPGELVKMEAGEKDLARTGGAMTVSESLA